MILPLAMIGPERLLRAFLVVEDLGFPRQRAGSGVEREDVVVGARVDDLVAVDRQVAIDGGTGMNLARSAGSLRWYCHSRSPVLASSA